MNAEEVKTISENPQSPSVNPQTDAQTIADLQAELAANKAELAATKAQVQSLQALMRNPQPRADKEQVAQPGVAMNEDTLRSVQGDISIAQFKTHDFLHTFISNDKSRHAGAGIKNIGFIDAAFECAEAHYFYIPHFRTLSEFKEALTDFRNKRKLFMSVRGFLEKLSHSMLRSSDVAFHNALDYYHAIKEAARHEDETDANSDYILLSRYFKHDKPSKEAETPSEAQLERDIRALLHGRKEGEIVIRNENARTVGGKREIKDDVHSESSTVHTVVGSEKKA